MAGNIPNTERLVLMSLLAFSIGASCLASEQEADRDHIIDKGSAKQEISEQDERFFENRIRPLLIQHCYECHSRQADEPDGGLLLDSKPGWMRGGDSGPAIKPGNPEASRLIEAVRYENVGLQMPPESKLADGDIRALERWIANGAPDPRSDEVESQRNDNTVFDLQNRRRQHWAWQPRQLGELPQVKNQEWPRTELDRFILARLEAVGLNPAPEAEKRVWLRRISFDLTGLAPSADEIEDFLSDGSPQAYQRVVDRLLRSRHFGEHWALHWLDLVRYAETRGHEQDFPIDQAFRYRDYVIQSFNDDVPYDQWVIEHIAGDLVDEPRLHPIDKSNQSVQGTGFWHLGEATHSPVDICGDESERFANQIDVFSRAFLGLSMACARCHDHKFDAISMEDYYALYGFLQSSSFQLVDVSDPSMQEEITKRLLDLRHAMDQPMREALVQLQKEKMQRLAGYLIAAAAKTHGNQVKDATLSEELVTKLVAHLKLASEQPSDPLHLFSRIVVDEQPITLRSIRKVQDLVHEELEAREQIFHEQNANLKVTVTSKNGERNYSSRERAWNRNDLIEDFSSQAPDRWITSGHRFGRKPAQPGELLIGDSDLSTWRVVETASAAANRISPKLTGMLRTATFEITSDLIWYRYRGEADLLLVVDSHRVVAGPLHGIVKQQLRGEPNKWNWKSQNVRDYLGHRVHAEFQPKKDFALDRIIFSATQPPQNSPVARWQRDQLSPLKESRDPLLEFCKSTVGALTHVLDRFADNSDDSGDAKCMNWMFQHDQLFEPRPRAAHTFQDTLAKYSRAKLELEEQIPKPIRAMALLDGTAENEPIHIRGNHKNRAPTPVPRRILAAMDGESHSPPRLGSGRLELAQQLVQPESPLLSRVMVNRIWHHLFGRGIVETVDDFGAMGTKPTHPLLLDYLAQKYIDDGWSTKRLIREIVLSSTYRMSSHPAKEGTQLDPANKLWHRTDVRRLPAESIRDHILNVSTRLDRKMFGPSVMTHITPFMRGNRSPKGSGPLDGNGRRSIYTEVRRNHLSAMLRAFDKPVPFTAIGKRDVSNSPAQSLIMLNDPFVQQQAGRWAAFLLEIEEDTERIQRAYVAAFARRPRTSEIQTALAFVGRQDELHRRLGEKNSHVRAWADLCHTLMNVKEFIHIN